MNVCARRFLATVLLLLAADVSGQVPDDRYSPVPGGWQIRLSERDYKAGQPMPGVDAKTGRLMPESPIGLLNDDARKHRRPLFPPAELSLIWTQAELDKSPRVTFRPLVLAYNAPRFVFDYHSAGGLLGHLQVGLISPTADQWLHNWRDITVQYVDGRMEYTLQDPSFGETRVRLIATPLADSVGLIVKVEVERAVEGTSLVWMYGGASGFFSNYNFLTPAFAFAPDQCGKDHYDCRDGIFELTRTFDKTDPIFGGDGAGLCIMRTLPEWKAHVFTGSSWQQARSGFGSPTSAPATPRALLEATQWSDASSSSRDKVVALQQVAINGRTTGYILSGMGGRIRDAIKTPEQAFAAALARNESIARRVVTKTPDPYLDAAVRMMAFATEGTWAGKAYVHGGWSWRFAYLGWRILYGPTCYGWTDRVRRNIQEHCRISPIKDGPDKGAVSSMLESDGVYYNMDEVFFDMIRHYDQYTNDTELMREIYPALEGMLERQNRRLRPGTEALYESALNTWISDSHWYIRSQCTQSSAYMLAAYRFMADLAHRLGRDPQPFRQHAQQIRDDMNRLLWQPKLGVFAECLDTRGRRLLHGEPELPTLYHAAEFGAADGFQIAQMLNWADLHLRQEHTPGGGVAYWSSNWHPNNGRSYTHSTHELAYAEELNFAETNYLAGRADEGYRIIRSCLAGVFNGPTPGGLACHMHTDGTQRANDEFADAISMFGRAVCEGLFGIKVDRPRGIVRLSPQLPSDWPESEIRTPHFSYRARRQPGRLEIAYESPVSTRIALRMPIPTGAKAELALDGASQPCAIEKGTFVDWATAVLAESRHGVIVVTYAPADPTTSRPAQVAAVRHPTTEPITWSPPSVPSHKLDAWTTPDLSGQFNANVSEVLAKTSEGAIPPAMPADQVGFGYWRDHMTARATPPCDNAWRAKIDKDGMGWTTDGIPFKSPKEGRNIAVVCLHNRAYPDRITFEPKAQGRMLYLMISGMTHPAQSHVPNIGIKLIYADGSESTRELVNPRDIGDCWSTWYNLHFDTPANGFENIGGRLGPAGTAQHKEHTVPVRVDTIAHLVAVPLRSDLRLDRMEFYAVANDVVFGIMGTTILK